MNEAIFVSVITSLVVAIVYGVFFAQREERIRNFFRTRGRGWIHRRYVKAFIGAIRGDAANIDSRILAYLTLWPMFFIGLALWGVSDIMANKIEVLSLDVTSVESSLYDVEISSEENLKSSEDDLSDIKSKIASLRSKFEEIKIHSKHFILAMRLSSVAIMVVFYAGLLLWIPFIYIRRAFTHEFERFMLRIQGLATNTELAKLATLEARVASEATLQEFVQVTREIAERHSVPELVRSFDVWMAIKPTPKQ